MACREDFTINDGDFDYDISVMKTDEKSGEHEDVQLPLESHEKFSVKMPRQVRPASSNFINGRGKMRNISFEMYEK